MKDSEDKNCLICYAKRSVKMPCCFKRICYSCVDKSVYANSFSKHALGCAYCREPLQKRFLKRVKKETMNRLERITLTKMLSRTPGVIFCPSPDCKEAFFIDEDSNSNCIEGTCTQCGLEFCINCRASHPKMSCKEYYTSNEEVQRSEKWKSRHSRLCPNCNEPIEKNGGCDNMKCKLCGERFVWGRKIKKYKTIWQKVASVERKQREARDKVDSLFIAPMEIPIFVSNTPKIESKTPSSSSEVEDTYVLPRAWDYDSRWKDFLELKFKGKKLKIKQSASGSRVGATVWDICIVMCKYFEGKEFTSDFFEKKRFIELGSGVGLLGIALASAGAQIVLTDQKPMLPLLQQNVDSNITLNKYKVSVAELDWGSNMGNLQTPFDVIVGTDVTYEEEGIIPLMKTLLALSDVNTEIYIAHEERNMDAESIFYTLVYKNFEYQKFEASSIHPNFADFKGWIVKMKRRPQPLEDD